MSKYRRKHSVSRSRNKKFKNIDRSSTSRYHRHRRSQSRDYRVEKRRTTRRSISSSPSSYSSSSSSSQGSGSESSSAYRRHRVSHFSFRIGDRLDGRYKMKKILGDGTFGRVIKCRYRGKYYAIKVIKKVEKYINSARTERSIIKKINKKDPHDKYGIVRYKESFHHEGNFCLVFKPLGKSLYDFIKMNSYKGFPIPMVQSFFRQILASVGFLHDIGYTHTDLKPENILLEDADYHEVLPEGSERRGDKYYLPNGSKIRIIDFGGATKYNEHHSSIINTRQYRSPEVILQSLPWNEVSDVWSIGCIIGELITGELLFPTHSDVEHLAMIEKMCGIFPADMIDNIPEGSALVRLFQGGLINQDKVERIENVVGLKILEQLIPGHPALVDLLRRCLQIDPRLRITCKQALHHPFFQSTL